MTHWIPEARLTAVLQWDLLLALLGAALGSWALYRLFLGRVSEERHRNLQRLFKNLLVHCVALLLCFLAWHALKGHARELVAWFGLGALVFGCTVLVKICRVTAFQYLFLTSMRAGVPVLLVNLLTMFVSIVLMAGVLSGIFGLELGPFFATSAIFSLVLGLALQDTLGNMLAGVALALDKPYEIGDWIEVQNGSQKWAGRVQEITWRATVLVAMTEEWMTIPNRVMGQGHIANFSAKIQPFLRSHLLRFRYGQDMTLARETMLAVVKKSPGISLRIGPYALIVETAESWVLVKLLYAIEDYGRQTIIGDEVLEKVLEALQEKGIELAVPALRLAKD